MKSSTFFTYLSVATAMVSAVNAQTNVYITGSTAFRSGAHSAIRAKMAAGYTMAFTGSDINSAAQAVFKGTIGTDPVNVYTSWSGSVAGIKALAVTGANAAGVRPKFLPSTQTTTPYAALLLRLALGVTLLAHGALLKLATFGLAGTMGYFGSIGFPPLLGAVVAVMLWRAVPAPRRSPGPA